MTGDGVWADRLALQYRIGILWLMASASAVAQVSPQREEAASDVVAESSVKDGQVLLTEAGRKIDAASMSILQTWAGRLREHPGDKIILEVRVGSGGSRSLALAVADRCLETVRDALRNAGVPAAQIRRRRTIVENVGQDGGLDERRIDVVRLIYEPSARQ